MNKKRVLKAMVVDDNTDSAILLEHVTKKSGFETTLSNSSEIAMHLMSASDYDVIITDWMMPKISGLDLVKWIRSEKGRDDSYIIMVTAKQGVKYLESALREGADDYIEKPLLLGELYARINVAKRVVLLRKERQDFIKRLFELNQKMESNLISGFKAQKILLPPEKIEFPEIVFYSIFHPAEFLSGDNYDFVNISKGVYMLYHIDMCGHGVAPALYGITIKTLLGNYGNEFLKENGIAEVMKKINENVYENIGNAQYFIMAFLLIDFNKNCLLYLSAGHPNLILIDKEERVKKLDSTTKPIGLFKEYKPEVMSIPIEDISKVIIISDGVTEARNNSNEFLGDDKVLMAIENAKKMPVGKIIRHIKNIADQWTGENEFSDDVSILGVSLNE